MTILSWDKPEKIMSIEAWKSISACGAPPGVYVSNMSTADRQKWKAKLIKGKYTRVEIRKQAGPQTQTLIVVSLPGQATESYNSWVRGPDGKYIKLDRGHDDNVRMSMNGPSVFSYAQFEDLHTAVSEAKAVLETLKEN